MERISGRVIAVSDTAKMYSVLIGTQKYYGWLNSKPIWLKSGVDVDIDYSTDPNKMSGKPIISQISDMNQTVVQQESISEGPTVAAKFSSTPNISSVAPVPSSSILDPKKAGQDNLHFAKEMAAHETKLKEFPDDTEREQHLAARVVIWFHNLTALDESLVGKQ